MYGGEGGIRSVVRNRTSTATLCDYHAGAYEHALGHVRFTARSNPPFAIRKKTDSFSGIGL